MNKKRGYSHMLHKPYIISTTINLAICKEEIIQC